VWLILRAIQLFFETDDPRAAYLLNRFVVHISVILRYAVLVFIAGSAVLSFDLAMAAQAPSWRVTFLVLFAVVAGLLFLQHRATSLKLAVQFQELSRLAENWRRFRLGVVRFLMVILIVWAAVVVGLHVPGNITTKLGEFVFPFTKVVLVITIYVVAGILIFYAAALVLFLVVGCIELMDRRRFAPATGLTTTPATAVAYEREEGGVNKYQNHLASLTYVKPGWLRWIFLRLSLFVIALLARFWFNRGDLGGIPTILAARWVLIDNGRRLLFFTNYGGGWDSYLNEFIDMGAVNGLNAIWTNTFLKTTNPNRRYAFPATKYYLWRGAEAERPFKAYVRQSQIETIVWYSAYPTLTITNINTNTELRQALFKPLAPSELDSVFLKAGL
jgi:hypothetical protein